jgi:hypothetical protein
MDSFVVHIYRRGTDSNDPVAGVVERIGYEGRTAFRTREELWDIIAQPPQPDERPSELPHGLRPDYRPRPK